MYEILHATEEEKSPDDLADGISEPLIKVLVLKIYNNFMQIQLVFGI
jgi:hypothetical protein